MYGRQRKKPAITVLDRKDITDYVRAFVWNMRQARGRVYNIRHRMEVQNMVEDMNKPSNTTFKSMRDFRGGDYFWHEQKVDFVASNLGRGFIFYFRCNGCGRRVKYLYEYSMLDTPLCRICCRLRYEQPNPQHSNQSRTILDTLYPHNQRRYHYLQYSVQ